MTFANPVTKEETYKKYLAEIGEKPNKKLERIFACGLPAAWLYLKAIGLEDLYFDLLKQVKTRYMLYKDLFYLMLLANGKSEFFPSISNSFLKLKVPPLVQAAQVQVSEPVFRMAYGFTRDQLIEVLGAIAKPGYMIRLGNQRRAIGIMFENNAYHVYHADNPRALEFKDVEGCVDLIMRVINERIY